MIDEDVLERLLDEFAQQIPVPADGAERVIAHLGTPATPNRRPTARHPRLMLAAAVLVVVAGLALVVHTNHPSKNASVATGTPASRATVVAGGRSTRAGANVGLKGAQGPTGAVGASPAGPTGSAGVAGGIGPVGPQGDEGIVGLQGPSGAQGATGSQGLVGNDGLQAQKSLSSPPVPQSAPTAPTDGALVVKTGNVEIKVPPHELHSIVDYVTQTVVSLGGYVVKQEANYAGVDPSGTVTLRVPVDRFEEAISRITNESGVTVLNDQETGTDVSAQYVNTQAAIDADTTEAESLLKALAETSDVNDIYQLRQQIAAVQTTINQLQGNNNLLRGEAAFSDLTVAITEALPPGHHLPSPAAHHAATGLHGAWKHATSGFSSSTEWFLARSGTALILFLIALCFVFGLRFLYPALRRALL